MSSEVVKDMYQRREELVDAARNRRFAARSAKEMAYDQLCAAQRAYREANEKFERLVRECEVAERTFRVECVANGHKKPDGTSSLLILNGWGTCEICGGTATVDHMKKWRKENPETEL